MKIVKNWLRHRLDENSVRFDENTFSKRERIEFGVKFRINEFLIALGAWRAAWRWPLNLITLLKEMELLHFSQLRKVDKGIGCVVDSQTWLVNGHNMVLGNFVKISAYGTVMAGYKSKIYIGSFTIIGPGVLIAAFNHGTKSPILPMRYQLWEDEEKNSIRIGENVWIGGNVIILPGAEIGSGSIVGAGSVVRGKIPENSICINKRDLTVMPRSFE